MSTDTATHQRTTERPNRSSSDLRLLNVKQLALLLGVSDRTIRRWRSNKLLPKPLIENHWSVLQIESWQKADKTGH
jgi:predicted DNA-binding transcriptional regulator AlpA